tara:strand:- start:854 stop:1063 length:210 start_codon:yes stop_codon:yes gene_type:complete
MKIKVNGQEKVIKSKNTDYFLNEIIKILGYKEKTVVVELNELIINSDKWKSQLINEGDKLEIVSVVGGG